MNRSNTGVLHFCFPYHQAFFDQFYFLTTVSKFSFGTKMCRITTASSYYYFYTSKKMTEAANDQIRNFFTSNSISFKSAPNHRRMKKPIVVSRSKVCQRKSITASSLSDEEGPLFDIRRGKLEYYLPKLQKITILPNLYKKPLRLHQALLHYKTCWSSSFEVHFQMLSQD